jgi:hypothetical protein
MIKVSAFKTYIFDLFRSQPESAPWPRMILCALASTLPLLVGLANGNIAISIYGSLAGYLLALNDHLGTVRHRLWVVSLTFVFLSSGFAIGFLLKDHAFEFQLGLAVLVYWLGILGGDGAELERGVLFLVISVIIVVSSKSISPTVIPEILSYCLLSYICVMIGIPIVNHLRKRLPGKFAGLRESFQKSLTRKKEKHIHAASYTLATLASLWLAREFQIERGYWIAITVLLVMRADRTQSFYKTLQRLVGTALGVLFCDIIIQLTYEPWLMIFLVAVCTLVIPFYLLRNYLFASFFITIFVVLLLEIAAVHHGDVSTPFIRLQATLMGCALSLAGSLVSELLSRVFTGNQSSIYGQR